MPVFDFEGPDGKIHSIEGPDGATPQQAFQMLQQHLGAPATAGYGEDAAKSIGSGLANATIGAIGGLGDIRSMASNGIDALGSKIGVDLSPIKTAANAASYVLPGGRLVANAPTSQDIKATITDPIVSPDYEPKHEFNRVLKKGAEFAPNMLLGGPEGLGARLLTNVAAPAVGSEIGEKIGGPIGGIAGALVGGAGALSAAQKFNQMAAARNAAKTVPTGEQLLKTGGAQFDAARDMNVIASPDFAAKAAADMRAALKGFDPEANKAVFAAADRLENLGKPSGQPMTAAQRLQAEMNWEPATVKPPSLVAMNDVDFIRKELVSLKTSPDGSVRDAARKAIASLQKSQTALTPAETLAGDAAAFTKTTQDAIGNWAAGRRSQTIQGKVNLAELNANSPVGMLDSATGGQALQRTMKQLARPVNNTNMPVARKLGFNNQEVSAINEAASGTKMQHAAELLDRLVPAKLGAIPAMVARQIGGLTTKRQVSALDSLVRSRSPLAQQVAAQLPPQIVQQLPAATQRLLRSLQVANVVQ